MSRLQNHCSQNQQQEVVAERERSTTSSERGRDGSGSRSRSRRNSFVEEGPPPPGYEEAMRDRAGQRGMTR